MSNDTNNSGLKTTSGVVQWENILRKDGFYVEANLFGTSPATAGNYGVFFTAFRACVILAISEVHEVLGTNGGAVTCQVEKLIGTTAPGSGTNILATAFDLKGTINTVVSKSGTDFLSTKTADGVRCTVLSPGDRLAIKDTGTLTDVAGLNVTVYFKPWAKGDYF